MPTWIREATVCDARSPWHGQVVDALVEGNTFKTVQKHGASTLGQHKIVEAKGAKLVPGFFDAAVHLTDPGYEHRSTLQEILDNARSGGYTGILGHPTTNPPLSKAEGLQALLGRAQGHACQLHIMASATENGTGEELAELHELHRAGAVAFGHGPEALRDASLVQRLLDYLRLFGGVLWQQAVEPSLAAEGLANESPSTAHLGLKGLPAYAESLQLSRDHTLLAYACSRLHTGPISTVAGLAAHAEAKSRLQGLSASSSVYHLLLDDSLLANFDGRYKVMPPLRQRADADALCKALADGTLDFVASHHTPLAQEDKQHEFSLAAFGAMTLKLAASASYTALVKGGYMDAAAWVALMADRPRAVFGLERAPIDQGSTCGANLLWEDEAPNISYRNPGEALSDIFKGQALVGRVQAI